MTEPVVSDLVAAGWPIWEERKNFTGLDDTVTVEGEDSALLSSTRATMAQRERGAVTWSVTGNEHAPRPGADYAEGDTVHLTVAPQGKVDPTGGAAAMRALGWDLNPKSGRSTPIFWDDGSSTDG